MRFGGGTEEGDAQFYYIPGAFCYYCCYYRMYYVFEFCFVLFVGLILPLSHSTAHSRNVEWNGFRDALSVLPFVLGRTNPQVLPTCVT